MTYCVYMLITKHNNKLFSYVGYTKNLKKRINLHNISRGAKYTRGKKWIVFHKENYNTKSEAMTREYQLKNDKKFRNSLREKFKLINKNKFFLKNKIQ